MSAPARPRWCCLTTWLVSWLVSWLVPCLALGVAVSPVFAEAPFGSPAWVREQEALRQAEDARIGRRPAAPATPLPDAAPPEALSDAAASAAEPSAAEPAGSALPVPEIAPSLNPLSRMAFGGLTAFRQRPLFAPSRRRPAEAEVEAAPPPSAPVQAESPAPELRLVGIVAGVDRAVALVSRSEGSPVSLRVGDSVESWRVDRIAPDRVVLREGGREQTYRLFAAPPAAAPGSRLPPGAILQEP